MSRLQQLPADLSAVLSLLLRRGKRYAEVAEMLDIQERTVHDRAHAALALLAPGQARALSAEQREQLGEYLLGQQSTASQRESRGLLETSAAARAWAQALALELAPLATGGLPEIPSGARSGSAASSQRDAPARRHERAPAPAREPSAAPESAATTPTATPPRQTQPASSRVGGAVILGGLGIVVVVVVLLVLGVGSGGGGGSHSGTQSIGSTTSTAPAVSTSTSNGAPASTSTTSTGSSAASHGKALTLTPPDTATSKAIGVAYVLTQKSERAFYIFAKGLPALPSGSFYAVWLEGARGAPAYPLGSLPSANANGLVEGGGPLPTDASSYRRIIVTSETSHRPAHPGPTALGGVFSLS